MVICILAYVCGPCRAQAGWDIFISRSACVPGRIYPKTDLEAKNHGDMHFSLYLWTLSGNIFNSRYAGVPSLKYNLETDLEAKQFW